MRRILYLMLLVTMAFCLSVPSLAEEGKAKKKADKPVRKGTQKKKKQEAKQEGSAKQKVKKKPVAAPAEAAPLPAVVKGPALVKEMRYWSNPDYTRIAVSLDREVHFEYHQLPQNREAGAAPRMYIDITGARLTPGIKDLPIGDGLLKTARIAQYKADTVRVVLDMDSIKEYKVFTFADPFRIIVDVKGERRQEITRLKETIQPPPVVIPLPKTAAVEKVEERVKPEEKARTAPKPVPGKVRRIVVDPGHGGHDPGAIGQRGTNEKDVVLELGLRLARKLRDELGLDVVMTRSSDVFLELQERTGIANQVGADLFVSIHANAALNRSAAGIETYYLNLAKTEKAAQLAAKENGTSLEKVSLLQAVLFDLMANYKLNDSAHLADEVQKALYRKVSGSYQGVKNLGVKQGPFYVLVGATMPSILVETAFLSNDREEERLNDPLYQDATAEGILEGVRAYITSLK
jgi:N-acetylmuramoyl-L-alanine amidase